MSDHTASSPDQRIAELRARRRARLRWLAIRGSLAAGALTLLLAAFVYWLISTIGGRDLLLRQIVARLPEGAHLSWTSVEGPARGPLTLHGLRYSQLPACLPEDAPCAPDRAPIVFTAQRVYVDFALRPLLGRRLRLDALQVSGATLDLARDDKPFDLPTWPEVLPDIAPPLALQADDVRVDGLKVSREGEPLIDIRRVRGGLDASDGALHVERLVVDSDRGRFTVHGDYVPRDDYRMDLLATAVMPAPDGRTPARLGLVAKGDLARLDIGLGGAVPGPLRAGLVLRDPSGGNGGEAEWRVDARADAIEPALLLGQAPAADAQPLVATLRANGVGGEAQLSGEVAQGAWQARILPSRIHLKDKVLDVQPLALQLLDGNATLRGHADFREAGNGRFNFAINARGLRWAGTPAATTGASQGAAPPADTPAIVADADLGLAGTVQAWAAIGKASLQRDGQTARLDFDSRGNAERMGLKRLQVRMPSGTLDGTGELAWAPALGWTFDATLAGFDPGYFAPDWSGAVNGTLASTGQTRGDGGLELTVDARQLGGRLRGRPLSGRGRFAMHGAAPGRQGDAYEGEVVLGLGDSRIDAHGKLAQALELDAAFAPLHLADLLPDADGSLRGTLQLRGARDAPDVTAALTGDGLRYGEWRADTLVANGRLPWRGSGGALRVDGSGLAVGLPLQSMHLDARGAVESLQLDADAGSEFGTIALSGNASKRGATWQGTLASLQLAPLKGASWRLQQAAQFRWDGSNGALSAACLASSGGGSLCADAQWPRRGLDLRGTGLPLTLALPYLPERSDRRPWFVRGEIDLQAQLRPIGNSWRGTASVTSTGGGLRNRERSRREVVRYAGLTLDVTFDPQRLQAVLGASIFDDGRIDARVATGWDAYAPLSGEIAASTDELTWMELFSPDIVEPTGKLDGRIALAGTRAQPRLGGQAQLREFATELPALAIHLSQGDVRLDAQPDGSARINGSLRSGEGTLAIDGTLGWQGDDTPLMLRVRGDNVLVSDTRDLRAIANPDVTVRYAARQPLQVTGTVTVPEARIDLERLDQGVSASPDVVVLDPVDPERTASNPLEMDLTLALGDKVRLNGFGLDGSLGGRLRVIARPGREMAASGRLDVDGRYTAYGQKLDITRGQLVWSNGPVADPILDIRAEREVGEVTAGVDVKGRASAPEATVWSDPASSQSEALSYLALGRSLSTASGDESRQLNAASAALSAGGSMLASQLGAKIGLDDAGVMESRALGESVFGVGKYLSPRLYVGYGVSLLGTGQVLTLKYLLRRGFDVEIESSTVENRASVNWRLER